MKFILSSLYIIAALWAQNLFAFAAESEIVNSGRTKVQLVTSHDSALPGTDIHIALSMRLEKHWHTYWRNAGGPGKPADFRWTLPDSLSVGDIIWPLPKISSTQTIVNYVFEDRLLLPMVLHISEDAKIGETIIIQAEAAYLVCHEVCLPESATLSVPLTIGEPIIDGRWNANIKHAIKSAPKPDSGFKGASRLDDKTLAIDIIANDLRAGRYKNAYFFPYTQDLIDADAPQVLTQGQNGISLSMPAGWVLSEGIKNEIMGVIAFDAKTDGKWKRKGVITTLAPNTSLELGAKASSSTGKTANTPWLKILLVLVFLSIAFTVLKNLTRSKTLK